MACVLARHDSRTGLAAHAVTGVYGREYDCAATTERRRATGATERCMVLAGKMEDIMIYKNKNKRGEI
jgi:hypothetical protein